MKTIKCDFVRMAGPGSPILQITCAPDTLSRDKHYVTEVDLSWDREDAKSKIPSFYWTHIAYLFFGYCAGSMMRGAYCGEFKVVNALTGRIVYRSSQRAK
jgi:hypothetical protein